MSHISVNWENESHTLIRWEFEKGWKWAEVYEARKVFDQLLNSVPHPVDVIFNMNNTPLPFGDALQNFKAVGMHPNKNMRLMVVVKGSIFGIKITQIVMLTFRIWGNMLFANSLEEAKERIATHQAKLAAGAQPLTDVRSSSPR